MELSTMDPLLPGPLLGIQQHQMCLKSGVSQGHSTATLVFVIFFLSDNAIVRNRYGSDKNYHPKEVESKFNI